MLFLTVLESLQEKYPIKILQEGKENLEITHFSFLSNNNLGYDSECLYAGTLKSTDSVFNLTALITTDKKSKRPPDCWVLFLHDDALTDCMNSISDLFLEEQKREYDFNQLLYQLINNTSLHALVDQTALFLNRSIIITDLSFRVIDYSASIPITDLVWLENIERGYCDYEFIIAANESMPPSLLSESINPFLVDCESSTENRLCCTLIYNQQHIGYIAMLDNEKGVLPYHYRYLPKISALLVQALKQLPTFHTMFVNIAENIFLNLLYGENAAIVEQRLLAAGIKLPPIMKCCSFLPKSCTSHDRYYLQNHLQLIFPSGYIFVYEQHIIAIVPEASTALLYSSQYEFLNIVKEIGISSKFTTIQELPHNLTCALHACEIAKKLEQTEKISSYESFLFYDLLLACPNHELLIQNIHPALEILHKYDLMKESHLLETLHKYIASGKNINETADVLYLHRNSLRGRLNKIKELTDIDFDDQETLFQLACSFRINALLHVFANY